MPVMMCNISIAQTPTGSSNRNRALPFVAFEGRGGWKFIGPGAAMPHPAFTLFVGYTTATYSYMCDWGWACIARSVMVGPSDGPRTTTGSLMSASIQAWSYEIDLK